MLSVIYEITLVHYTKLSLKFKFGIFLILTIYKMNNSNNELILNKRFYIILFFI
jgi:hypothetical protein